MNSKRVSSRIFFILFGFFLLFSPKSIFAQTLPFDVSFPPVLLLQQENSKFAEIGNRGNVASWQMPLNEAILEYLGEKFAVNASRQENQQITQIIKPAYNISDDVSITTTSSSQYSTNIVITSATTNNKTITFPDASGEVSLLGQTITGSEIVDDTIDLLTKTTGNYLAGLTGGNGLTISSGGSQAATPSVSLGNLTGDWTQTGAYDIVLDNTDSALKILDSDGTSYATIDVGNLSSDITYTISGTAGTLLTSANYSSFITNIGDLLASNNLSDLGNASTSRVNLGLGTIATQSAGNIFLSGGSLNGITIPATLNTISGLTTTNFSTANISQWTNNSGFITSSTTDTLTNKTLTAPVINGTVTTSGLTLPAFTAGGNITGSGSPIISSFGAINGLTLTASSDGLTIAGGTTARTLTVTGADITIGNVIKPTSAGALTVQANGANTLTLDSGGNAGINIGTSNANTITLGASATVSANKTFSVTTADNLLVGGIIVPQLVTVSVPMTASLVDQNVFVADASYQLSAVRCVYSVAASLNGTLQVTVDTGSGSPGSGTDQLSSTINLSTTTNTVYAGSLIATPTTIAAGDKVSLDMGGTLLGLLGTCTLTLKRV